MNEPDLADAYIYAQATYPPSPELIEHKLSLCHPDWHAQHRAQYLAGIVSETEWLNIVIHSLAPKSCW